MNRVIGPWYTMCKDRSVQTEEDPYHKEHVMYRVDTWGQDDACEIAQYKLHRVCELCTIRVCARVSVMEIVYMAKEPWYM